MTNIEMKNDAGGRKEMKRRRTDEPVKFGRNADGKVIITSGDPAPEDVARAITRSKKRRAAAKQPIGRERAAALRQRLARKLRQRTT